MEKSALRRKAKAKRRAIGKAYAKKASYRLAQRVLPRLPSHARRVALYCSQPSEMPTSPLIALLQKRGVRVFLPTITGEKLRFGLLSPHLFRGSLGIMEPRKSFISPRLLDAVIMPLVAFDASCRRLGMGKGYYDKTFSFRRQSLKKPKLIGIAFEAQKFPLIPTEPHDVMLDGIATETAYYPRS